MSRTYFCIFTLILSTTAVLAKDGSPNLDIAGIKIGMGAHDAMAALKADNPKLNVNISSQNMEGFAKPLHASVTGQQGITQTNDAESIEVLFTMPPNKEQVWGISRLASYRADHRPSTANTLAALRNKYGPENISSDPTMAPRTVHLIWLFDADGKLVSKDKASSLNRACAGYFLTHFGSGDRPSFNEIQTGKHSGPPEMDSVIVISADIQSTETSSGSDNFVVYNLIVQMNHGPMYRAAIKETRAQGLAAVKTRDKKEGEDANKNGAPKL